MSYWYDKQGKVIAHLDVDDEAGRERWIEDMVKVEKLLTDMDYKVVKQEFTPGKKYWISTVWLGLDHSFSWHEFHTPNPHPIIFESMVFSGRQYYRKPDPEGIIKSGYHYRKDYDQIRYETEAEALAGHEKLLAEWTEKEQKERARRAKV